MGVSCQGWGGYVEFPVEGRKGHYLAATAATATNTTGNAGLSLGLFLSRGTGRRRLLGGGAGAGVGCQVGGQHAGDVGLVGEGVARDAAGGGEADEARGAAAELEDARGRGEDGGGEEGVCGGGEPGCEEGGDFPEDCLGVVGERLVLCALFMNVMAWRFLCGERRSKV